MTSFFKNWGLLLIGGGLLMIATVFLAKPAAAALPKVGELCDVISEPGYFSGGKSFKTSEITCPAATTPFCDKENRVCVQCLTPDKQDYDKSKACESGKTCIKGRCVPLETPLPKLKIQGVDSAGKPVTRDLVITGPASYILYLYSFGLRVAGVLAFLLVLFYGAAYIISTGNETKTKEYKEKLGNVLVGVIVLLGSYIILQTINPTLTQLKEPQFKLKMPEYVGVCNKNGNIELKPKSEVATSTKTYDVKLFGLPCACQILTVQWGQSRKNISDQTFRVGEKIPYTLYPAGCQYKDSTAITVNITPYIKEGSWTYQFLSFTHRDAKQKGQKKIEITTDTPHELDLEPDDTGIWYLYIEQSNSEAKLRTIQSPLIEVVK